MRPLAPVGPPEPGDFGLVVGLPQSARNSDPECVCSSAGDKRGKLTRTTPRDLPASLPHPGTRNHCRSRRDPRRVPRRWVGLARCRASRHRPRRQPLPSGFGAHPAQSECGSAGRRQQGPARRRGCGLGDGGRDRWSRRPDGGHCVEPARLRPGFRSGATRDFRRASSSSPGAGVADRHPRSGPPDIALPEGVRPGPRRDRQGACGRPGRCHDCRQARVRSHGLARG